MAETLWQAVICRFTWSIPQKGIRSDSLMAADLFSDAGYLQISSRVQMHFRGLLVTICSRASMKISYSKILYWLTGICVASPRRTDRLSMLLRRSVTKAAHVLVSCNAVDVI